MDERNDYNSIPLQPIKTAVALKFIYYACDGEDLSPIGSSNTFQGLLEIVDDFMGATDKYNHSGKRIRYEPYSSKYGSDFDGTIYYKTPDEQKVKVYTVEFNYKKEAEQYYNQTYNQNK